MPPEFDPRVLDFVASLRGSGPIASLATPINQPCTAEQILEPTFDKWVHRLGAGGGANRKVWEWAYICEILEQHAATLDRPMRMLGFGVGREPIVGWFANQGHDIVATDLPADEDEREFWDSSDQHAASLDMLDMFDLCPRDELARRVTFQPVDMRSVPMNLRNFDVVWSSCAFEHLGNLEAGLQFVRASLSCLAPGGVGVHTTEFNVSSGTATVSSGPVVLYRRDDLDHFVSRMTRAGFDSNTTFDLGEHPDNALVDRPPYSVQHLRVLSGDHVTTSYGLKFTNTNSKTSQRTELARRLLGRGRQSVRTAVRRLLELTRTRR
ncbi:MAG: class I SAM-dependent methyltransferase [Acidimicrobiales bacterium]|jgi:hypothetical protein